MKTRLLILVLLVLLAPLPCACDEDESADWQPMIDAIESVPAQRAQATAVADPPRGDPAFTPQSDD